MTAIKKQKAFLSLMAFIVFVLLGWVALSAYSRAEIKTQIISSTQTPFSLIMIEEHGCPYCRAWMRDVGDYYHKTPEGKFAPLTRVNTDDAKKKFNLNVNFTPTFIVLKNGKEVGRLLGYIDDSFFWPKLDEILSKQGYKEE